MSNEAFEKLVDIFKALRHPETGCPWDIKQTHQTLVHHLIEECYELADAIENEPEKLQEELGDVLLQVMLHSQIAADEDNFNIYDVIKTLSEKLIIRHPHVFGDAEVKNAEEVKKNWDKIKRDNKKTGVLDGVPKSAPALFRAETIGKKVAAVNFDWETGEDIKEKIKEELQEFLEADTTRHKEEELGDLLFTLSQYARKMGFSSETALQKANQKFTGRFKKMEAVAGCDLSEVGKEDLEKLWKKSKDQK